MRRPGYLVVTEGNALIAEPFDAADLKLKGKAFPIIKHGFQGSPFSVSSKGLLGISLVASRKDNWSGLIEQVGEFLLLEM